MSAPTRASVTRALRAMSSPAGNFDASRYFRGDHGLRFYNAGTARMRAFARSIYAAQRDQWDVTDAVAFAGELMRDPYLDTKSVGIELVARYRKFFTPPLLRIWKQWLAADLSANWATTDAMCGLLIGPLIADHPAILPRLRPWARGNLWVRRASIVSLIAPMRKGLAVAQTFDTAKTLHGDPADLIQKAVGWALREAGKQDPARLERYLRRNGRSIPRTTVRYAIERFPADVRRELLTTTRDRVAKQRDV